MNLLPHVACNRISSKTFHIKINFMPAPTLYAHSGRSGKEGKASVPPQSYKEHIEEVRRIGLHHAQQVGQYSQKWGDLLKSVVHLSSEFHDFGKLDPLNQTILAGDGSQGKLPVNHVDAGVAHLFSLPQKIEHLWGAYVIHAHHRGLCKRDEQMRKSSQMFRDFEEKTHSAFKGSTAERVEKFLADYLSLHEKTIAPLAVEYSHKETSPNVQLFLRMALACLADADHGDTARHYANQPIQPESTIPLLPAKRLEQLDQAMQNLSSTSEKSARNALRTEVYQACRNLEPENSMYECDSPVGTGKTTAVMAHLLKVAAKRNLRRIFVVLPFTNIIEQSAKRYRETLVFKHESPEQIIGEHHHKAEFQSPDSRQFTYLWKSPIVVTTAVQFFETLASNRPSALRKLHQLPGSAIFLDEAHAALPVDLLPQGWDWMKQLQEDWGCHLVFGSGSLVRFWEESDLIAQPQKLTPLLPASLRKRSLSAEKQRLSFETIQTPLSLSQLTEKIAEAPGPRLVIVNTVQSAAVIAHHLKNEGHEVKHISTALTPYDRKAVFADVEQKLKSKQSDWVLVATSCIEAGVDFSFHAGFRERCSLTSLLQIAGRINRNNEYPHAILWDFSLEKAEGITKHPGFDVSARVLETMFAADKITPEFATKSIIEELRRDEKFQRIETLRKAEASLNFPEVEKLFKVIQSDTKTAIVSKELIKRLLQRQRVSFQEIQNHSVQIWSNKIQSLGLDEIAGYSGLYRWTLKYDSFLGYMAGVLETLEFTRDGFACA